MKKHLKYFIPAFSVASLLVIAQSFGSPINTLSQKINAAKPGDTIFVDEGTYSNINIEIKKKFTSNIVVRPKVFGSVIFTGQVAFKLTNCNSIKFEGFLFEKTAGSAFILSHSTNIEIANNYFYQNGIDPNHSIIRVLNGSSNNIIDFNTFNDIRSQGILIATYPNNPNDRFNTGNKIYRNHFYNIQAVQTVYPDKGKNGMESMMVGFGGDITQTYQLKTEVYQNLFENITGDGSEIISNKTSSNVIRENTFLNNKSGISIRSGSNVEVIDNYLDNTDKGIRIFGNGHVIKNNFIIDCNVGINLPTADFATGDKASYTGYYQQDNISISDNFIINSKQQTILLGDGKRRLQPKNVSVVNNAISYTDKSQILDSVKNTSISQLSQNKYLQYKNDDNSNLEKNKEAWYSQISDTNKILPFVSNDPKVGATWKK